MKYLAVVLFFVTGIANAASYTVTCDPPTSRSDGTSLSSSEIQEYQFLVDGTLDGTSTTCSYTVTRPDGSYTITARTVDTGGRVSTDSGPFTLSLQTAPPSAPSNLR